MTALFEGPWSGLWFHGAATLATCKPVCKLCGKRNVPSTNWCKFPYIFLSLVKKHLPIRKFHAATAKKSDRKASVIVREQSVQSNVLLVKTHCFKFLTLLQLSNETNYSIAYKKNLSRLVCSLYTDVVLFFFSIIGEKIEGLWTGCSCAGI